MQSNVANVTRAEAVEWRHMCQVPVGRRLMTTSRQAIKLTLPSILILTINPLNDSRNYSSRISAASDSVFMPSHLIILHPMHDVFALSAVASIRPVPNKYISFASKNTERNSMKFAECCNYHEQIR